MIINIARVESFKKTPERARKEIDEMVDDQALKVGARAEPFTLPIKVDL